MMEPFEAAVLGQPIAHSLSPALHNTAYRLMDVPGRYSAFDLAPENFDAFLDSHLPQERWRGFSVTMPLKELAAHRADTLDHTATLLGVANTLVLDRSGSETRVHAHNTDVDGIVKACAAAGIHGLEQGIILGGGGTALAALAALTELGATEVTLLMRNVEKAEHIQAVAAQLDVELSVAALATQPVLGRERSLTISTLPPRAADSLLSLVPPEPGALLDVAYDPWPSALATTWSERAGNSSVISGKEMLLYQALEQIKLFLDLDPARQLAPTVVNAMCEAIGLPPRQ